MRLLVLAISALVLTASASAGPAPLTPTKARIAAYTASQGYFGDLFDSKIRIGKGKRLSASSFTFPGRIGRSGGYVNCTFRIFVSLVLPDVVIRARNLRCA